MTPRVPKSPAASTEAVRAVMVGNRKRDTRPELALRSALHGRGLRYRVDLKLGAVRSAPRPDIAFTRVRVAVFVDGCFWHGCPEHGTSPRINESYWSAKIARNQQRDAENDARLRNLGWVVMRVWEHEETERAADAVEEMVRSREAMRLSRASRALRSADY